MTVDFDTNPLTKLIKPHVADIEADAGQVEDLGRRQKALLIISLYGLHTSCPRDPAAPALCEAAFRDWQKARRG